MSMKALKDAVKKSKRDTFADGTVIKWTASGTYTYAAVKTAVGWFTTAREYNSFVEQVVSFDELLEILGRSETSDVMVATAWETVGA